MRFLRCDSKSVFQLVTPNSRNKNTLELAEMFGVQPSTINNIVHGTHWKHVGGEILPKSMSRGEWNGRAKLTLSDIEDIKHLSKTNTCRQIAEMYSVHFSTIARAINGTTWGSFVSAPED